MDREQSRPDLSGLLTDTEAAPNAPRALTVISVCTICKSGEAGAPGPLLLHELRKTIAENNGDVRVRAAQCLGVCKRPATVAVSSDGGYTFVFGDLSPEAGADALAAFVRAYRKSSYGLVPWRQRAEILRKGMIARIPPANWPPEDGCAPT